MHIASHVLDRGLTPVSIYAGFSDVADIEGGPFSRLWENVLMKLAWVCFDTWSDELAAAAIESGADALVLPEGLSGKARALGRVRVVSPGGPEPGTSASSP